VLQLALDAVPRWPVAPLTAALAPLGLVLTTLQLTHWTLDRSLMTGLGKALPRLACLQLTACNVSSSCFGSCWSGLGSLRELWLCASCKVPVEGLATVAAQATSPLRLHLPREARYTDFERLRDMEFKHSSFERWLQGGKPLGTICWEEL
jgi:hypothetical protein